MHQSISSLIKLNNQVLMPQLGFGTYRIFTQEDMVTIIDAAINAGCRSFDTAQLYKNEQVLGSALKGCRLKRSKYFVTTKIANDWQGYDNTLKSFERSLKDLQLDFVDLLLVHWPLSHAFFDTWRAFERIYEEGCTKAIGVCNFNISHFELLSTKANVKPMINQIELHPYMTQEVLVKYLRQENIAIEAWSPLARGKVNEESLLIKLGEKYNKSPSQITLRWHIQHGYIVIPKSSNPARIKENTRIFDFELTADEMQQINDLNQNLRIGPNPDDVYKKNGF